MPCIIKWTCIILDCAPCDEYFVMDFRVICLFPELLLLARVLKPFRSVRIRSTTPVRLLHGFDLLPSGIIGKMIITLDTATIIAMLVVSILSPCLVTCHLFVKPPKMP